MRKKSSRHIIDDRIPVDHVGTVKSYADATKKQKTLLESDHYISVIIRAEKPVRVNDWGGGGGAILRAPGGPGA